MKCLNLINVISFSLFFKNHGDEFTIIHVEGFTRKFCKCLLIFIVKFLLNLQILVHIFH